MTIVFDVTHPAHINLFKNAIKTLEKENHTILITALDRGRLINILEAELPGRTIKVLGNRTDSNWGVFWEGNLKRTIQLFRYLKPQSPNILIGSESISILLAAKALRKPSILFSDDPERPVATFLKLWLANKVYYPVLDFNFRFFKSKAGFYKALKQWAYLSPSQFTPNTDILKKYRLEPYSYIFVRDVSTASINYKDQHSDSLSSQSYNLSEDYSYLLSLEDKSTRSLYPASWIVLQEPVPDIYSLMYYSKAIISTGDSMVREGAMLGVPSFYCGIRKMSANKVMKDRGLLFEVEPSELPSKIKTYLDNTMDVESQKHFIQKLDNDWIDLTEFIIEKIEAHAKK